MSGCGSQLINTIEFQPPPTREIKNSSASRAGGRRREIEGDGEMCARERELVACRMHDCYVCEEAEVSL